MSAYGEADLFLSALNPCASVPLDVPGMASPSEAAPQLHTQRILLGTCVGMPNILKNQSAGISLTMSPQ